MDRRDFIRSAVQSGFIALLGCGCSGRTALHSADALASGAGEANMDHPADPYQYAAYCGLYCGACDWMMATQAYERQKAAGVEAKPPEYPCHGCKSDLVAPFCASCSMRACAGQRSIQFCFECSDYPCAKLIAFRDDGKPHHEWAVRNLEVIRRAGSETWVAQQHSRWRCSGCGTPFGFYARKCKQCGQPVRSCKDDLT